MFFNTIALVVHKFNFIYRTFLQVTNMEGVQANCLFTNVFLLDNVTLHLDGVLYFRVIDPYQVIQIF